MHVFPRHPRRRALSVAVAMVATAAMLLAAEPVSVAANPTPSQWTMFGQNLDNTANGSTTINAQTVQALKPKWTFTTGGDVSARAAVAQGVVYFPDWSGHVYAVKAGSGKLIWSKDILTDYLPFLAPTVSSVVSRTSPFLDTRTGTLYLGTQQGAYLLAINAKTGVLRWATQLDSHPLAIDTQSPIVFDGVVYVGVASLEEGAAANPAYPCCTFRGSVVALDASNGAVRWKTYTVPAGYSGGAVWGSTIVPDPARGVVYATTGNNYTSSAASPDNHIDSVVALSMTSGAYVWADRFADSDDWNVACFGSGTNCPVAAGPDFDFGSGVQFLTVDTANGPRQIIGAGQKSGVYSAIDPTTGAVLWATQVGPGSALGGMEWGSATDGRRIYVQIGNLYGIPTTLSDGSTTTGGSWAALDPVTGQVLWHVADPNSGLDLGPLAVANGVVYAPSMGGASSTTAATMVALDAATGATLWSYAAGSSVIAGASIAGDTIYWGSGYSHLALPGFTGNHTFYAFSVNGQ